MSFSIIAASQDDWVPTQIYQALPSITEAILASEPRALALGGAVSRGRPGVSATLTTAALIASAVAGIST